MANTPRSKKQKGVKFEKQCAKRISEVLNIEAKRTPMSGAIPDWKGDITSYKLPVAWECKNVEKLNFREAWRQAENQATPNQMPVLLTSRNYEEQVISLVDFEDLLMLMEYAIRGGWLKDL